MNLKKIHELAQKHPDYEEFLKALIKETKHSPDTKPKEFECRVNHVLGNRTYVERNHKK